MDPLSIKIAIGIALGYGIFYGTIEIVPYFVGQNTCKTRFKSNICSVQYYGCYFIVNSIYFPVLIRICLFYRMLCFFRFFILQSIYT